MTGKGSIGTAPSRRLGLMVGLHVLWLVVVCLLGIWWGRLLLRQAAKIAELEVSLGISTSAAHDQWERTQRMLYWESGAYFLLLLASTALLLSIYWRDARRSRGVQAFFASVTHELRTPLTSIRLQAESIAENLAHDGSQKHLVERLLEDTMRLESQVEKTLELARVEGGGPIFTRAMQVQPWLERLIRSWKSAYGERVEFEVKVEDVTIEADPAALQVIVRNLIENSVRHSRAGEGPVRVRIETEQHETEVSLHFSDSGRGYEGDPAELGRIFLKGEASQGAGVGLYLVKLLMRRMGGRAEFASRQGFRATLRFRAHELRPDLMRSDDERPELRA